MQSEPAPTNSASRSGKLWLCGGGTGGHVYPALAVAAALRERAGQPGGSADRRTIVYVGSADGMERGLVERESDLPFLAVPAAAVRGRAPWTLARNGVTLARGALAARRLIARDRPAAILGTGGYVCVPVFLAARAAGVPTAIYLPDVVPGLAVRFLARIATAIACNVADSAPYLGFSMADGDRGSGTSHAQRPESRLVVTGYPVRPELFSQDRAACRAAFGLADGPPTLLVYGGSRGARSINRAVAALLPDLLPLAQIIHVCGREGDEQFLREAADSLPEELRARYRLYPYLHSESGAMGQPRGDGVARSMIAALGAADLALCRSGASALGELPAAGLPAVLVPYPFVHQEENADYLARHGAALKVRDEDMLGDGRPAEGPLFSQLRRLIVDSQERALMAQRCRNLAQPEAAVRLADLVLALAARRRAA